MRRRHAHALACGDIIRNPDTAGTKESSQAAASWRGRIGFRRGKRARSLKLIARGDVAALFISAHYHCPNAYVASPCTTVV
jgi:hypothetical protein